ncbi:odorant receptor 22c-like [Orussus abietinus]|uniref:odorant receptor 22c-like n=1 Tax=Orussus abietinus TaxID=222816 RepID=UPI000C715A8B|nr:odorant receptor 22c-like [Orussus abietinus]
MIENNPEDDSHEISNLGHRNDVDLNAESGNGSGEDVEENDGLRFNDCGVDFETGLVPVCEEDEPKTYDEVMASNEARKWKEAVEAEIIYKTMFIFQVVLVFVTCPTYAVEAFFLGITMHLSGQFEIIKLEIHKIGHDEKVNGESKKIEAIINNHIHLLKTSMYLENVFNSQILLQLLTSSMLVCISVSGYQLTASVESGDGAMLVKNIGLITVMLLQPLIYCFAGDHLSSQSEGVKHAAYNCQWYNLSAKHAKDILFIIRRADIPVKLTAGKFVTMSLSQYLDVIKTAASYMSFLRVTYS